MTIVLKGKEQVEGARMIALKHMLRLELRGMRANRGRTAYSIIKQEFGLKGNKQKVFDEFSKLVSERTGI